MSTKTQTDNTMHFNPVAQQSYNSLVGSGTKVLNDQMNNPFGNAMYKMGLGASQQGATQQGNNNMSALQQMMRTSGIGGNSGNAFQMAQQGKIGRSNASMMSQANTSNVQGALQRQLTATGMGMSFSPQLTGSSATQTQSGLGTWLPQLLGAAGSAAMGFATGGASTLAQGASKTATSIGQGVSSPFTGGFGIGSGVNGMAPNPMLSSMYGG